MNNITGVERTSGATLNPNDPLAPYTDRGGVVCDYGWLIEEAHAFMDANPEVVACMEERADTLVRAMGGAPVAPQDIVLLPELIPNRLDHIYPGSAPQGPMIGLQLTLDNCVKQLTGRRYFVHDVSPMLYEAVRLPGSKEITHYDAFGLIAVDDMRAPAEYRPDFALALSRDHRYAAIVHRVSDRELQTRREKQAADDLAASARACAGLKQRDHHLRLQEKVRVALSRGVLSPVIEQAITATLGVEGLRYIKATEYERLDLEPAELPEAVLNAAQALLAADGARRRADM
jgi:hypothetical protein